MTYLGRLSLFIQPFNENDVGVNDPALDKIGFIVRRKMMNLGRKTHLGPLDI